MATYEPATGGGLRRLAEIIRITAYRGLKVRYRGTALGVLWSFANPVMLTIVYTTIFGTAFSRYYDGSVVRYLLSAFVALVAVTFFLTATGEALASIVANGTLLNKIAIQPIVFPISAVASNLIQHLITTFPIVFVVSIVVTRSPLHVALVPVVLIGFIALTLGFSLALSALFVFFRDLPHLWAMVGFILWMTSPVFYPVALVPPSVRPYYELNPIGQGIVALREVSLDPGPIDFGPIVFTLVAGFVALAIGAWLFRMTRREFMDLL
jgi:ABC-type polysaccharide/polyol phosphate export permease